MKIVFGNLVVGINAKNFFKTLGGFFVFTTHRKGNAQAVVGRDIVRDNFQNSFVEDDSFFPGFVNRGFDGFLLQIVRVVIVHAG